MRIPCIGYPTALYAGNPSGCAARILYELMSILPRFDEMLYYSRKRHGVIHVNPRAEVERGRRGLHTRIDTNVPVCGKDG